MDTMTYTTQNIWTWWIALYLFFGGLGAATLSVSFLTDMYCRPHRNLVVWGALSGVVMLAISSAVLFGHLLHHTAVIHVLNPLVLFYHPDAWIAWGTQFILWMMVWGTVYALPYLRETPLFQRLPLVGSILQLRWVVWLSGCSLKWRRVVGWLATINGIGTAVYTGLLLQSFPAVALWHNPGVPLLFTVSAFSTAFAYLLLLMNVFIPDENDKDIRHLYERLDVILIATELVILFSFFNYTLSGSESGVRSAQLLWHDLGWLIGFIGFGLVVPFFLELKSVIRGAGSGFHTVAATVMVLIGGYMLRHYFMYAGVYAYPW
ncbi:MAG TPA: NrfD/PsrC family molybdoenzyme membrane anchor subunit [Gallionella sp.]|nr:NrfD/PsrC family molybdoenzyme membrane anchor subunit [Gallionella sp.]